MHVLADLRAGADGRPRVHHCAFVHIGANVYKRWHEDHVFAKIAAATGHGRRHHANASRCNLLGTEVREFGLHLVVKREVTGLNDGVILQAERQQYGFFKPLMGDPLAVDFFSDAFATSI